METKSEKRWFLRCRGCLSVMATHAERPDPGIRCSACEGTIEVMGMVRQERLTQTAVRCACDLRCTMAMGPNCDCQCGGKNHGSQITVTVVKDLGGVPRITPVNPEKARRVYGEWLQAKRQAEERVLRHFPSIPAYRRRETRPGTFDSLQGMRGDRYLNAISKAEGLKTHHARLKALAALQKRLSESAR